MECAGPVPYCSTRTCAELPALCGASRRRGDFDRRISRLPRASSSCPRGVPRSPWPAVRFLHTGLLDDDDGVPSRPPRASEAEIRSALSGNLCRCTGYQGSSRLCWMQHNACARRPTHDIRLRSIPPAGRVGECDNPGVSAHASQRTGDRDICAKLLSRVRWPNRRRRQRRTSQWTPEPHSHTYPAVWPSCHRAQVSSDAHRVQVADAWEIVLDGATRGTPSWAGIEHAPHDTLHNHLQALTDLIAAEAPVGGLARVSVGRAGPILTHWSDPPLLA